MLRFFQSVVLALWILLNTLFLIRCHGPGPVDPRPYVLLNLLLSVEAAVVNPLLFADPAADREILVRLAALQATLGAPPEPPEDDGPEGDSEEYAQCVSAQRAPEMGPSERIHRFPSPF